MVDLIGVSGSYTRLSMIPNVAEVPLPPGAASPRPAGFRESM